MENIEMNTAEFIEVSHRGEWNAVRECYEFEEVDCPSYFRTENIEWFTVDVEDNSIIFGLKGYDTVFKPRWDGYFKQAIKKSF